MVGQDRIRNTYDASGLPNQNDGYPGISPPRLATAPTSTPYYGEAKEMRTHEGYNPYRRFSRPKELTFNTTCTAKLRK